MALLRPTLLLISEKSATYMIIWSYTTIWQFRVRNNYKWIWHIDRFFNVLGSSSIWTYRISNFEYLLLFSSGRLNWKNPNKYLKLDMSKSMCYQVLPRTLKLMSRSLSSFRASFFLWLWCSKCSSWCILVLTWLSSGVKFSIHVIFREIKLILHITLFYVNMLHRKEKLKQTPFFYRTWTSSFPRRTSRR